MHQKELVEITLDADLKTQVDVVLAERGLNYSEILEHFYAEIIRCDGLPAWLETDPSSQTKA